MGHPGVDVHVQPLGSFALGVGARSTNMVEQPVFDVINGAESSATKHQREPRADSVRLICGYCITEYMANSGEM